MGVSKNGGTPKSSILIGFSIINHPFWGTPIFGNSHIVDMSTRGNSFTRYQGILANYPSHNKILSRDESVHSGKPTDLAFEMYFLLKMGIFQPAMLVYQRIVFQIMGFP